MKRALESLTSCWYLFINFTPSWCAGGDYGNTKWGRVRMLRTRRLLSYLWPFTQSEIQVARLASGGFTPAVSGLDERGACLFPVSAPAASRPHGLHVPAKMDRQLPGRRLPHIIARI